MNTTGRPWVAYGIDSEHPLNKTIKVKSGDVPGKGKRTLIGDKAMYGFRVLTLQSNWAPLWGVHSIEVLDDNDNEIVDRTRIQGCVPLATLEDRLELKVRPGQRLRIVVENYDECACRFCATFLGLALDPSGYVPEP